MTTVEVKPGLSPLWLQLLTTSVPEYPVTRLDPGLHAMRYSGDCVFKPRVYATAGQRCEKLAEKPEPWPAATNRWKGLWFSLTWEANCVYSRNGLKSYNYVKSMVFNVHEHAEMISWSECKSHEQQVRLSPWELLRVWRIIRFFT